MRPISRVEGTGCAGFQLVAQQAGVEELRVEAAPAGQRAGQVLVVIRVLVGHRVAHPGLGLQVLDHLGGMFQIGQQAALVHRPLVAARR
jgi:hypothetical protein